MKARVANEYTVVLSDTDIILPDKGDDRVVFLRDGLALEANAQILVDIDEVDRLIRDLGKARDRIVRRWRTGNLSDAKFCRPAIVRRRA